MEKLRGLETNRNREEDLTNIREVLKKIIGDYGKEFDPNYIKEGEERILILEINGEKYAVLCKILSIGENEIIVKFHQPLMAQSILSGLKKLEEKELNQYRQEVVVSKSDDKSLYLAKIPISLIKGYINLIFDISSWGFRDLSPDISGKPIKKEEEKEEEFYNFLANLENNSKIFIVYKIPPKIYPTRCEAYIIENNRNKENPKYSFLKIKIPKEYSESGKEIEVDINYLFIEEIILITKNYDIIENLNECRLDRLGIIKF